MASEMDVRSSYAELLNRPASADDIARWATFSNYEMEQWIRGQPEYANSNQYKLRYVQIQWAARTTWGMEIIPSQVDFYIRSGIEDDQIIYGWRNTRQYKEFYKYKPDYMTEQQYLQKVEEGKAKMPEVKETFSQYVRPLTDDEYWKIVFGGAGSEWVRGEYARAERLRASYDAMRGKVGGAKVAETPLGPVQPGLGGIQAGAPSPVATRTELPGEKYLTYADYKEGIVNPKWDKRAEYIKP